MKTRLSRRSALGLAGSAAVLSTMASMETRLRAAEAAVGPRLKGRIRHSVCRWCYQSIPLDDLCRAGREMGLSSVELVTVEDFGVLKKHGLNCAMVSGVPGRIENGLNRVENHEAIVAYFERVAPMVAAFGAVNIICFSGNRRGMPDEQGLENCARALKRIAAICERHQVVAAMELLNSRVDHKDYMCDHTAWGLELCKRVNSEHFKLLYDIYHMQIMEGDVIRTITGDKAKGIEPAAPFIAHYHTGGVPGRAEIDDTQELNYPAIMNAIVATGFKGHVAQEFIPKRPDALASLRQGVGICDV